MADTNDTLDLSKNGRGKKRNLKAAGLKISNKADVTQATNITTAVTADGYAGTITTVSSTLAANAAAVFTVNNTYVTASSIVLVSVEYAAASNGSPYARVCAKATGSFNIELVNVDASAALNAVVKISYVVIN